MHDIPVDPEAAIPVTIVTGFLGSGKTTLLARLLGHAEMADTAVIVNEIGEIGLDHLLVQGPADETVLLDDGCVCCTMRGDLVVTLQELLARRIKGEVPPFRRVIVETTGTADPVPIVQTLVEDADVCRYFALGRVVTLVDARNGAGQLDAHFQSVKQAAIADLLLLTKTDLVEEATAEVLAARLRGLNPGAPIVRVLDGGVASRDIIGIGGGHGLDWLSHAVARADSAPGSAARGHQHGADEGDHRHHHHEDDVETFAIRLDEPVEAAGLKLWLDLVSVFQGRNLLRVKGLVNVAGRPVVINLVQHVSHPPVTLEDWPGSDRTSRIVFITRDIERAAIESTLTALSFRTPAAENRHAVDPDAYARFANILEQFHGAARGSGG